MTNKDNYKNNITIPAALSFELSGKVSRLAWALGNAQAGAEAEKRIRIESRERREESRVERKEESKQERGG